MGAEKISGFNGLECFFINGSWVYSVDKHNVLIPLIWHNKNNEFI